MRAATFYRAWLIVGAVAFACYWLLPYSSAPMNSTADGLMQLNRDGAKIHLTEMQHWIWFVAWNLAAVGMFFYMRYARELFVTLLIISTAISPFLGLLIQSAPESTLVNLSNCANGVALAMAYFSPVAERFTRRSETSRDERSST